MGPKIAVNYTADPHFKPILEKLLLHAPEQDTDYTLSFGIIRYKGIIVVGNNKELRQKLLVFVHSSAVGGHSAIPSSNLLVVNEDRTLKTTPEAVLQVRQIPATMLSGAVVDSVD